MNNEKRTAEEIGSSNASCGIDQIGADYPSRIESLAAYLVNAVDTAMEYRVCPETAVEHFLASAELVAFPTTFEVTVQEVWHRTVKVQADSLKAALEAAAASDCDDCFEFSHQTDPDAWTVNEY